MGHIVGLKFEGCLLLPPAPALRIVAHVSHPMASLFNCQPFPSLVNPTKTPAAASSVLRTGVPIMHRHPIPLMGKSFSRPSSAIQFQKYVYPDPDPEFAAAESQKFKAELLKKLSEDKGSFGDDLHRVVNVCAEIFSEFLHQDYGGPGTLLIEPFTDMMVAIKEQNLPGAEIAARASLLWAQNYVDQDWRTLNSKQLQ